MVTVTLIGPMRARVRSIIDCATGAGAEGVPSPVFH